jgi:YgiT-type zinc finger domain-containing protein
MTPETPETPLRPALCPRCGGAMRPDTVKTAIWLKDRLVVVEDIPAQVCDACMEQFYDDDTTDALRRLTEEGFATATPKREVVVPIFSLEGRIMRRTPSEEDLYVDY